MAPSVPDISITKYPDTKDVVIQWPASSAVYYELKIAQSNGSTWWYNTTSTSCTHPASTGVAYNVSVTAVNGCGEATNSEEYSKSTLK